MNKKEKKMNKFLNSSLKLIILDVLFMILYMHHLPHIMNGGDHFSSLIDTSSVIKFMQSYIGKIFYLFIIFMLLHCCIIPFIRKRC
jgi:hypothetical protein